MNSPQSDTPIACTLGAGDMKARLDAIAELNGTALISHVRHDLRLELIYAAHAREQVMAMVRAEQSCCPFLNFAVHDEPDVVRVIVEAPDGARAGAEQVLEPFHTKPARNRGCC